MHTAQLPWQQQQKQHNHHHNHDFHNWPVDPAVAATHPPSPAARQHQHHEHHSTCPLHPTNSPNNNNTYNTFNHHHDTSPTPPLPALSFPWEKEELPRPESSHVPAVPSLLTVRNPDPVTSSFPRRSSRNRFSTVDHLDLATSVQQQNTNPPPHPHHYSRFLTGLVSLYDEDELEQDQPPRRSSTASEPIIMDPRSGFGNGRFGPHGQSHHNPTDGPATPPHRHQHDPSGYGQRSLEEREPMQQYHDPSFSSPSHAQSPYRDAPTADPYSQHHQSPTRPTRSAQSHSPPRHPNNDDAYAASRGSPSRQGVPHAALGAAAAAAAAASSSYHGQHDHGNYGQGYDEYGGDVLRDQSPYGHPGAQSSHASYSSGDALTGTAAGPAYSQAPYGSGWNNGGYPSQGSPRGFGSGGLHPYGGGYHDNNSMSRQELNNHEYMDPNDVVVDHDDTFESPPQVKRRSLFNRSNPAVAGAGTGAAGAAAGAAFAASAVPRGGGVSEGFAAASGPPGDHTSTVLEKSPAALSGDESGKRRRRKKILFIVIVIFVLCGIAGGVVGGIIATRGGLGGGGSGSSSKEDTSDDLGINSKEIKKLMNNKDLHKVFMGMAYTPLNTQYPDCLNNPASQNNVTRDIAVISQLTNVIRIYGTDCNQTEFVLHAINRLELKDMKVWVGVWLGNNATTNSRQIQQMYDVLDKYGTDNVKGVAVGNEVLFRQEMTEQDLKKTISDVRTQLGSKGFNLPVASSDLGDNWTTNLASAVDVIMSNVHPFFGGVTVEEAAEWTWVFWQGHDVALTKGMPEKQHVVSEVGWPSAGGNDCSPQKTCPDSKSGAVSGIPQMNTLMNDWVCDALKNQTQYLWFEAFDEPWKVAYNEPGREWEDKWGLFDVNRNLKDGIKIPDCGGATVPAQ